MLKNNRKSLSKRGSLNPQWKGDNVGYKRLHSWVIERKPKPEICPKCKKRRAYDLANKGIYNRDLDNWEWLCRKCHMESDGRLKEFLKYQKKLKKGNTIWKLRKENLKGEKHPGSKLTDKQVSEIRKKYSSGEFTQMELAKEYSISFQTVHLIVKKKTWKHV